MSYAADPVELRGQIDPHVQLIVYLGNGEKVELYFYTDDEAEEVAEKLAADISAGKPRWMVLQNAVFFTGAISAIEVL